MFFATMDRIGLFSSILAVKDIQRSAPDWRDGFLELVACRGIPPIGTLLIVPVGADHIY